MRHVFGVVVKHRGAEEEAHGRADEGRVGDGGDSRALARREPQRREPRWRCDEHLRWAVSAGQVDAYERASGAENWEPRLATHGARRAVDDLSGVQQQQHPLILATEFRADEARDVPQRAGNERQAGVDPHALPQAIFLQTSRVRAFRFRRRAAGSKRAPASKATTRTAPSART